jgi:hypothetical protein
MKFQPNDPVRTINGIRTWHVDRYVSPARILLKREEYNLLTGSLIVTKQVFPEEELVEASSSERVLQ